MDPSLPMINTFSHAAATTKNQITPHLHAETINLQKLNLKKRLKVIKNHLKKDQIVFIIHIKTAHHRLTNTIKWK